ncbi:hypothetical protein IFM89_034249 [Coptis chinensis]|uniref:Uncharacterized protein n=1 Tax=Coptis chinensis TaxID=261450 RepID=A0A835HAB4_9MAGN|nr:hypothetical protein IFM89_034249 [Coptis chinensis]
MNGEAPSSNQEGSRSAPGVEAAPALGVVEEITDASDFNKELNIKSDGMVEETTEASDMDEESSIEGDCVVEETTV